MISTMRTVRDDTNMAQMQLRVCYNDLESTHCGQIQYGCQAKKGFSYKF